MVGVATRRCTSKHTAVAFLTEPKPRATNTKPLSRDASEKSHALGILKISSLRACQCEGEPALAAWRGGQSDSPLSHPIARYESTAVPHTDHTGWTAAPRLRIASTIDGDPQQSQPLAPRRLFSKVNTAQPPAPPNPSPPQDPIPPHPLRQLPPAKPSPPHPPPAPNGASSQEGGVVNVQMATASNT